MPSFILYAQEAKARNRLRFPHTHVAKILTKALTFCEIFTKFLFARFDKIFSCEKSLITKAPGSRGNPCLLTTSIKI